MKKQPLILVALLIWTGAPLHAHQKHAPSVIKNAPQHTDNKSRMFKNMVPKFLYNYMDFHFDSTTDINYNRFRGNSNLYSVGVDGIELARSLCAGLYVFRIDTDVSSQSRIAPGTPAFVTQSLKNGTLYGHILKIINSKFAVDFSGGYGQTNSRSITTLTPIIKTGTSTSRNSNFFTGITGSYRKQWKKLSFKANVGALYSQIDSGVSVTVFSAPIGTRMAEPLTNKVTFIHEGIDLKYKLNDRFSPFIEGSLLQVAQYQNSRPILSVAVIGAVPQLEMNKNAYKLGAGIAYNQKHYTVKLEQKYYNAGGTFISNLTLLGLDLRFN
jgi:hypothetical protein